MRELWKTVSNLLVPQTAPPDNFLAQQFSAIFNDKVDAIRSSMVGSSALTSSHSCLTLLHCYSPVTTSVIARLLGQSPNKQCSLDPCPTRLVKSLSIMPDILKKTRQRVSPVWFIPVITATCTCNACSEETTSGSIRT